MKRKKDLLSKIAFTSFEDSTYFFKQKTVEKYIADYIQNLPDAQTDESALLLDSQQVLQSIVAQHGLLVPRAKNIYSFSHLTFHEYFTARQIIEVDKSTELVLQNLVEHLFEKSWREVFLLAVEMSSNADLLVRLMKHKIDSLLADDPKLQEFLTWLNQKSLAVNATFSPQEVAKIQDRLDFIVNQDLSLSRTLDLDLYLDRTLSRTLHLDLDLYLDRTLNLYLDRTLHLYFDLDLSRTLDLDLSRTLSRTLDEILKLVEESDSQLHQAIKNLRDQLPDKEDKTKHQKWWQANGKKWAEELRAIMVKYRNIGHDWQFSHEQKELLSQYYRANQFLTQCLAQVCKSLC